MAFLDQNPESAVELTHLEPVALGTLEVGVAVELDADVELPLGGGEDDVAVVLGAGQEEHDLLTGGAGRVKPRQEVQLKRVLPLAVGVGTDDRVGRVLLPSKWRVDRVRL